jgi:hypothetical protein
VQNQNDLILLKELLEVGKIVPVIDRCYSLDNTAAAFRYSEKEHMQDKVVITVRKIDVLWLLVILQAIQCAIFLDRPK